MTRLMPLAMAFAFVTAACGAQASGQAATPASEFDIGLNGRVTMQGAIFSSACDIDTGDGYQTVAMGSESRSRMRRVGEGEPRSFSVTLKHCSLADTDKPEPWQYLQVTFDGEEEDGMFKVSGAASGVALELTNKSGDIIRPGEKVPYQLITTDDIRLDYQLKLKTTMRNIVVGNYQAMLRYRVDYF